MKKSMVWYVIADGGRARFVARDDEGAFRTLSSFVSTELHKSAHELGKDRPARVKESASPARSAIEPRRDLHEAAKEDFIAAPYPITKGLDAIYEIAAARRPEIRNHKPEEFVDTTFVAELEKSGFIKRLYEQK